MFADGSRADVDLVVFCTGYRVTFPFFEPSFVSAPNNELPLFMRCFHLEHRGLLFAGLAVPTVSSTPRLVAWKLGDDFKHFGHAAPATRIAVDANGRASEVPVSYNRVLDSTQGDPAGPGLRPLQLPLEGQVKDIHAGIDVPGNPLPMIAASDGADSAVMRG